MNSPKKFFINKLCFSFIALLIFSIICGSLIYWLLWVGCTGHSCMIYTSQSTGCAVKMFGKENTRLNGICFPGCIDDIESYSIGTHLNRTCYVLDIDYKSDSRFCNIVPIIKIPLLPPICKSIKLFWTIPIGIIVSLIWMISLIIFCYHLFNFCRNYKNLFKNKSNNYDIIDSDQFQ